MYAHSLMVPAFLDLSTTHLIIIAVILLLLFGAKLPSIMRNLGSSVHEFKKGMDTPKNDQTERPDHKPEGTVSRSDNQPPTPPKA